MSDYFPIEELKERVAFLEAIPEIVADPEVVKTINDIYAKKWPSTIYPEGTLLTVTLDTPMKAKDIRALLHKKVIGVETFAVGDEVELATASFIFSNT
jgi:hypothetical protein